MRSKKEGGAAGRWSLKGGSGGGMGMTAVLRSALAEVEGEAPSEGATNGGTTGACTTMPSASKACTNAVHWSAATLLNALSSPSRIGRLERRPANLAL